MSSAAGSAKRIVQMKLQSPYSASTSLCHLTIPPEPHRRRCEATADRLMWLVNLLLLVRPHTRLRTGKERSRARLTVGAGGRRRAGPSFGSDT